MRTPQLKAARWPDTLRTFRTSGRHSDPATYRNRHGQSRADYALAVQECLRMADRVLAELPGYLRRARHELAGLFDHLRLAAGDLAGRALPGWRTALARLDRSGRALVCLAVAAVLAGVASAAATAAVSPAAAPAAAAGQHAGTGRPAGPVAMDRATAHRIAARRPGTRPGAARGRAHVRPVARAAAARHAALRHRRAAAALAHAPWRRVILVLARRTDQRLHFGDPLPLADRLRPGPPSGPQYFQPISSAQMGNAVTIVRQDLDKRMGIRSAVIAVATAMQESSLINLDYGDRDSLGLFQQRPSCGWGTPAQITDPRYASDAFLNALRRYQRGDRGWARQPLWQAAQGVQDSGFPYAYAQWEDQAAHIVAAAARRIL